MWFSWTAPDSGRCVVNTLGDAGQDMLDTILSVYEDHGTLPDAAARIATNDDIDGMVGSRVTFNAIAGRTYAFQVGAYQSARGIFPLHLSLTPVPPIQALTYSPIPGVDNPVTPDSTMGEYAVAGIPLTFSFTLTNDGGGSLTNIALGISGLHASEFTVTQAPPDTLGAFASAPCVITFSTTELYQIRSATVTLSSSDATHSPLNFELQSFAVNFSTDTDGDGLNDASELQLKALGFDFEQAQPALVNALFAGANGAGLFTKPQLQGLHAGASFAARNPQSGRFRVRLDLSKSRDLETWTPFPVLPADTTIDAGGGVLFEFDAPGDAAFFKLGIE